MQMCIKSSFQLPEEEFEKNFDLHARNLNSLIVVLMSDAKHEAHGQFEKHETEGRTRWKRNHQKYRRVGK